MKIVRITEKHIPHSHLMVPPDAADEILLCLNKEDFLTLQRESSTFRMLVCNMVMPNLSSGADKHQPKPPYALFLEGLKNAAKEKYDNDARSATGRKVALIKFIKDQIKGAEDSGYWGSIVNALADEANYPVSADPKTSEVMFGLSSAKKTAEHWIREWEDAKIPF